MVKPSASYTKPVLEDVETGDGKQLKASGRCAACRVRNPGKTRSAFTLALLPQPVSQGSSGVAWGPRGKQHPGGSSRGASVPSLESH